MEHALHVKSGWDWTEGGYVVRYEWNTHAKEAAMLDLPYQSIFPGEVKIFVSIHCNAAEAEAAIKSIDLDDVQKMVEAQMKNLTDPLKVEIQATTRAGGSKSTTACSRRSKPSWLM